MKKAKFLQDVKIDPARFYRNPSDVMRDRRLTDEDRRQIIAAWERTAGSGPGDGIDLAAQEQLQRLRQLREQLEQGFSLSEAPRLRAGLNPPRAPWP
jgi:hypothetical protein